MSDYIRLHESDVVSEGDEFLSLCDWLPVPKNFIGSIAGGDDSYPIRRRISADSKAAIDSMIGISEELGLYDEQKEWVDGLPPVGVKCEMKDPFGLWRIVDIFANYNGYAFGWRNSSCMNYYSNDATEFRPIKSQAEREADKREASKNEILGMLSTPTSGDESIAEILLNWHLSQSKG